MHTLNINENLDAFALRDAEDIFGIIHRQRSLEVVTRNTATESVQAMLCSSASEERVLRTLRCAINIWLDLGLKSGKAQLGRPEWILNQSLQDFTLASMQEVVMGTQPSTLTEQQLPGDLTAASLDNYHGFAISWTHDLTAHLSIDWKQRVLTVYEHKIFAYNHIRFKSEGLPVPDQLYEEVIDTLNLLFPFQDVPTRKLLDRHHMAFYGLGLCGRPRKLLLNDYHYWRGRIADIYQISQSVPGGFQQLLVGEDGRNYMSAFTFWITVAAGVVAVVGLGLGVTALVYSVKQYELGLQQYTLSVIQLCIDPSVSSQLPEICSAHT